MLTETAVRRPAAEAVAACDYPGRGLIAGLSVSGSDAAAVYFTMARSADGLNRTMFWENDVLRVEAADPSKLADPKAAVYRAVRRYGPLLIIASGDHTDTIYNALTRGQTLAEALRTRAFEADAPHFTPRVSALLPLKDGKEPLRLSILKAQKPGSSQCARQFFEYDLAPGESRYLHTYQRSADVLPAFAGEPEPVILPDTADEAAETIWEALNPDERVSLFVCYTNRRTGAQQTRLINRTDRAVSAEGPSSLTP